MAFALVAVTIIAFYAYEDAARDVVLLRDSEIARISAARLSEGLSRYSQVLQYLVGEDDVQSMEQARMISALKKVQNSLYVFDAGVAVYDFEGFALWSNLLSAEWRETVFPLPSEFDKMRMTLRPVFSDIFHNEISGEDVILVGVPIVGSDGEFKGVLAGMYTIRYSLIGATYAEVLELKAGRSGYAYLVDGNGRVIYHRDSSQLGRNLASAEPVMRATSGETGAILTEDLTRGTVVSGFAPVPGTGWGIITQEKWENIVGPIRGYSTLLLGLLSVGGVISSAMIYFAIGRVLKPIQDLTEGARRVAGGDFDHTIVARTGDEIQALAQQFNAMANSLKESFTELDQRLVEREKAELALQEYSEKLEEMVEQRTKELRDTQEELVRREKLAVLGQLAGGVGHELRNPLGAIKNAAYFLNMVLEEPEPEVKETLEILEKEVTTSERIISSLLDFARAKSPIRRKVEIKDVLQEALSRVATPENIEVVSQLDETLPTIMADPDQLGQVFGNIVLNAIQAMPEGGRLTVKSESINPERVEISIADTGTGIPEENLEKIWEPLFTTKAKGIGLGLAIAKTVVEGHGGTIEVESTLGKGSTFTVKLPIRGE